MDLIVIVQELHIRPFLATGLLTLSLLLSVATWWNNRIEMFYSFPHISNSTSIILPSWPQMYI